jgi:hypothetical protein
MIIIDLDNTISDDGWRIGEIDLETDDLIKRYHTYHMLCGFDELRNRELFEDKDDVYVFTTRPHFYMPMTVEWLRRNKVVVKGLFMRNGHERSVVAKKLFLEELLSATNKSAADIVCAYDDREDVVKMYKEMGVNAKLIQINKPLGVH